MKKLIIIAAILLVVFVILGPGLMSVASGAEIVANGSTSQSFYMVMLDRDGDPNTSITVTTLDMYYVTDQNSVATKIDCTDLGSENAAYTSGGCYEMGTSGLYRFDFPNAAFRHGIGKRANLWIDDAVTGTRTAYLCVMLSPQVDANTVVGAVPIPLTDIEGAVDAAIASVSTGGNIHAHLKATDDNVVVDINETDAGKGVMQIVVNDYDEIEGSMGNWTNHIYTDLAAMDTAAEMKALVLGSTMADMAAGAPAYNATFFDAVNWLYQAWRNKTDTVRIGDVAEIRLYKDDASTVACESDVSDDGTTFIHGEYGAED